MTVPGYYRTRMCAAFNTEDDTEECGVCAKEHSPLSFTIVALWSKERISYEDGQPLPRWESEDKFVCSRDCLMTCLTAFMIEQEACGRLSVD